MSFTSQGYRRADTYVPNDTMALITQRQDYEIPHFGGTSQKWPANLPSGPFIVPPPKGDSRTRLFLPLTPPQWKTFPQRESVKKYCIFQSSLLIRVLQKS